MGCDIHMHVEAKVDGQWQHVGSTNHFPRNYDLFGRLAGVRGDLDPIVPCRGLPNDVNPFTAMDASSTDWHSHSWLSFDEMMTVVNEFGKEAFTEYRQPMPFGMYLCGNYITDYKTEAELYGGVEDIRFVFWFDN